MRTEYGQRLLQSRKHKGLTQTQLAKEVGMSQGNLAELERSGQGSSFTPALARVCGVSVDWLAEGIGHMLETPNVTEVKVRKRVPLISWVKAGSWSEVQDIFQPGDAEVWEEAYHSNPGRHTFALMVDGDSMTSPFKSDFTFPHGTIILVDPDAAYKPNDFVVAKDVVTDRATFKQLVMDGGRWFLKPLNPAYPTQEIDDPSIRIIGRVIEFRTGRKL